MHQNIIGRSAASKMSFGDLLCFNEAAGIPAVSKELEGYLLFPRSYRDTCCLQGATGIPAVSKELQGYVLFPRS
jgi:hypothetical protein